MKYFAKNIFIYNVPRYRFFLVYQRIFKIIFQDKYKIM